MDVLSVHGWDHLAGTEVLFSLPWFGSWRQFIGEVITSLECQPIDKNFISEVISSTIQF
jgi:hypothetical protein